jgi:DNA polymerase-3 subunit alpha
MTQQFVHLHQHSEFSPDGLRAIDKMIDIIQGKGFSAAALTDHGTLAGSVSFYLGCKRRNIKPILGVEGYI